MYNKNTMNCIKDIKKHNKNVLIKIKAKVCLIIVSNFFHILQMLNQFQSLHLICHRINHKMMSKVNKPKKLLIKLILIRTQNEYILF